MVLSSRLVSRLLLVTVSLLFRIVSSSPSTICHIHDNHLCNIPRDLQALVEILIIADIDAAIRFIALDLLNPVVSLPHEPARGADIRRVEVNVQFHKTLSEFC